MRYALLWLAGLAMVSGGAVAQEAGGPGALPDPDYCARRDADPRKCRIDDEARGAPRTPEGAVAAEATPMPDPDYCSRRDADPSKCVVRDGPPAPPFIRRPGDLAAPNFPAPPPDIGGPVTPPPPGPNPAQPPPAPLRVR